MNKNIIRIVQTVKGILMLIGAAALILSMVYTIRGLFKSQDTLNAAAKSQSSAADSEPKSSGFLTKSDSSSSSSTSSIYPISYETPNGVLLISEEDIVDAALVAEHEMAANRDAYSQGYVDTIQRYVASTIFNRAAYLQISVKEAITQEGQYLDLYSLDYYPPERTLNNVLSVAKGEFNSNGAVIEMSFISTNDISEAQEIMEEQIGSPVSPVKAIEMADGRLWMTAAINNTFME